MKLLQVEPVSPKQLLERIATGFSKQFAIPVTQATVAKD